MAKSNDEKEIDYLAKTMYAEARGESDEGQKWVGHVIKNRANANRQHWGGNTIEGVCKAPYQFECWNGKSDIDTSEKNGETYRKVKNLAREVYYEQRDPTGGADHYNNPSKEKADWVKNVRKVPGPEGGHQFYKE